VSCTKASLIQPSFLARQLFAAAAVKGKSKIVAGENSALVIRLTTSFVLPSWFVDNSHAPVTMSVV
jgi:fructose-specific component phosphotransferase system IIB-like protein